MSREESIENVIQRPFWSLKDIARIYGYSLRHVMRFRRMPGFPRSHCSARGGRYPQRAVRSFMYDLGCSVVKEPKGKQV